MTTGWKTPRTPDGPMSPTFRRARSRWLQVAAVLLIGAGLSVALSMIFRRAEWKEIELGLKRDAQDAIAAFEVALVHGLDSVTAVDALYSSVPNVGRAAFQRFTAEHLLEEPGVVFLGWAPKVARTDRADFENRVRAETVSDPHLAGFLENYRIFEDEASDSAAVSQPGDSYPVLYAEPRSTWHTLGFDLASDPVLREAVARARVAGRRSISGRTVIDPGMTDNFAVIVFDPVFSASSSGDAQEKQADGLVGFALGMLEIAAVVEHALETLEPRGIEFVVHDLSASAEESLLYPRASSLRSEGKRRWTREEVLESSGLDLRETVRVGDREWLVVGRPVAGYVTARQTWTPFIVLIGGVLLSGSFAGLFLMALRRETEAKARTQELAVAKDQLEQEAEERDQATRQLLQAQETQEQILDSLPLNVFLKDSEGRIRFINAEGLRFLGRRKEEVVGRTDFDLFPAHVAEELRRIDRGVLAEGGQRTHEERLEVEGRAFHYLAGKTVVRVAGSEEPHLLGFSIDMTAIREAQEALAESEFRFRQLFENMSSGVAVYEAVEGARDFVFRDFNRAAERTEGLAREEVIGRRLTECFPGAEEMGMLALLQSVLSTGQPQRLPTSLYRDERLSGWRENYAYRLPSGEIIAIFDDVTERKRLEADLLHAQKMEAIGRLAGGVAHDFNNLLQVVSGNCDLLLDSATDAADRDALIDDIRMQAERGTQLVRRLLAFSRRDSHEPGEADLGDVLRGAETLVRRLLKENIRLDIELCEAPLPIWGDASQLEQVLMNLVVNAADAMPEGGELRIRSGARGDSEVWFSVADTGPGIEEGALQKIFEPYFTTKSAAQGTGLGLAVIDGIVSLHQGRIEVDNRPGSGVEFKVVLARSQGDARVSPSLPVEQPAAAANSERVLVVEDQELVRKTVQAMLVSLGYRVTVAASGAEALERMGAEEFDILVSDIVLPDVSGTDLAKMLQRERPGLAVVLVSGYAEGTVGESEPGVRFLQKPFRREDLARQTAAALNDRRAPGR